MVLVTNLLRNGDFSQGNEGWIIESSDRAQIITDPDPNKCYLKLTDSTGEKQYVVKQTVWVKPNQRYDLIAEVFYQQGRGKIWRKRKKEDSSRSSNTSSSEIISVNEQTPIDDSVINGNWRMHFFTDAEVSQVDIAFTAVSDSPSEEFIGGIRQAFLYEHNFIQNGDFSNYGEGWDCSSVKFPDGAYGRCLEVNLGGKAIQEIANIEPNMGYRLTFKNLSAYQGTGGNVKVYSINDSDRQSTLVDENCADKQWTTHTLDFNTNEDTIKLKIWVSSGSTAQFDEFSLSPIKRFAFL